MTFIDLCIRKYIEELKPNYTVTQKQWILGSQVFSFSQYHLVSYERYFGV
jgi:hypothetical protein